MSEIVKMSYQNRPQSFLVARAPQALTAICKSGMMLQALCILNPLTVVTGRMV